MERDIHHVSLKDNDGSTSTAETPVRQQPSWIPWTIVGVLALAGLILALPFFKGTPVQEARPGVDNPVVGTSGTHPVDEAVPGATSGTNAEGDLAYLPLRPNLQSNDIVAYMDRQPLYVVDPEPVQMNDRAMIVEEVANEESEAQHFMLYVPAANATTSDDAARFYYLKVGPNQYLKVTLEGRPS